MAKKASNEQILEAYQRLNNVWLVAKELGMCGQSVHERLVRMGKIHSMNIFSEEDKKKLMEVYNEHLSKNKLDELAVVFGRTKNFLCRQARELGLTDMNRKNTPETNEKMSKTKKEWFTKNEHPRGMLGKLHTSESKRVISVASKKKWEDPNFILNSDEYRQKLSDRQTKFMADRMKDITNPYSRCKHGWVDIGGKKYFYRSAWEPNMAAYFEYLKSIGQILDWFYEEDTFWFEKIKRGVRSYTPDFKIIDNDCGVYYVEVKGWMDEKSKTKIKRMALYYPETKLYIFDSKKYREISKSFNWIKGWGALA